MKTTDFDLLQDDYNDLEIEYDKLKEERDMLLRERLTTYDFKLLFEDLGKYHLPEEVLQLIGNLQDKAFEIDHKYDPNAAIYLRTIERGDVLDCNKK